jgi:hypothetical protein
MADGEAPVAAKKDDVLLLDDIGDTLATFRALRKSDEVAADELLLRIGGSGKVERDIAFQLGLPEPIYIPDRFEQAHRLVMRALEVLDRNGARATRMSWLGPLAPIGEWMVQLATRWIVRNHEESVIDALRNLYGRREASCVPGSPEISMLRRARAQAERLSPGYKGRAVGVPGFLLGGAVLSTALSLGENVGAAVRNNSAFFAVATGIVFVFFFAASLSLLKGAAVARHRISISVEQPLKALYETIGGCGNPPSDDSHMFALYAILLIFVAWIVIPIGIVGALLL